MSMFPLHPYQTADFTALPAGYRVPEQTGQRYTLDSPRVFAVTVDARILGGSRASLMDVIRSEFIAQLSGCKQTPEACVKFLMLVFHVIANSGLGRPKVDGEKVTSKTLINVGGVAMPGVDVYIETLAYAYDPERVVGYRYHFIVLDGQLNINKGIEAVFAHNNVAPRSSGAKPTGDVHPAAEMVNSIHSNAGFINTVMRHVLRDLKLTPAAYALSLTEDANPANIYRAFSLERAIPTSAPVVTSGVEFMLSPTGEVEVDANGQYVYYATGLQVYDEEDEPRRYPAGVPVRDAEGQIVTEQLVSGTLEHVHPEQTTLSNYLTTDGESASYCFPRGAMRVHFMMHHPNVMYALRFYEDEVSMEWAAGMPQHFVDDKILERIDDTTNMKYLPGAGPGNENLIDDDADTLHKLTAAEVVGKSPAEARAVRESNRTRQRFKRLMDPKADIAPAYLALFNHQNEMRDRARARNTLFSASDTVLPIIDPRLSWFGNAQAYFVLQMEEIACVATLHQECLMARLMTLSLLEHDRDLKINIIFAGGAQTGKSLICRIAMQLMVEGTYEQTSRKTKQAELTEVNKDGKFEYHDELHETYFETDGNGQDKERLTEGIMRTQMPFITADGKRTCVITISKHSGGMIGNTNVLENISDPVRSRHVVQPVSEYDPRVGFSPAECMARYNTLLTNADFVKHKDRFEDACKLKQVLVGIVYEKIYAGELLDVDLSVADITFIRLMKILKSHGVPLPPRDFMRLHRLVRLLAIDTAVHIVFFTRTVWPEPVEFNIDDVNLVQEFLFATEEMAIFAFTCFSTMFFHPQEHAIMKSCAINNLKYSNGKLAGQSKFARINHSTTCPEGVEDLNNIEFANLMAGFLSPLEVMAGLIADNMRNVEVKVAKTIVLDVLTSLKSRKVTVAGYYDDKGQWYEQPRDMPILTVHHRTVHISRQYLDMVSRTSTENDFFTSAIRQMQHAHTPKQKIVLGQTMRQHKDAFHPHILRTMELTNLTTDARGDVVVKPVIQVHDFSVFGAGMLEQIEPSAEMQPTEIRVDGDLEQAKWAEFMARLGRTQEEVAASKADPSRLRHAPLDVPDACPHCNVRACSHRDYPSWYLQKNETQAKMPAKSLKRVFTLTRQPTPTTKKLQYVEEAGPAHPPVVVTAITSALDKIPPEMRRAMLEAELAKYPPPPVTEEDVNPGEAT